MATTNVFVKIRDEVETPRGLLRPDVIEVDASNGRCTAFRGGRLLQTWESVASFMRAYGVSFGDFAPIVDMR